MLKKMFAVAVLALAPFAASASQLPDYPFIHASGTGSTYFPPDVGELDFEVFAFDADPEAARKVVDGRIAELRALVAGLGLPEGDIDVRDVRKEIRKAEPLQPGVVLYDIKCNVHIKVSDLSKWREVVAPLVNMPNLDSFITGFDTTKREQVEAELTAVAIKSAQRKAESIAAGFGRKLGAVSGVSVGDLKNLTRAMGLAVSEPLRSRSASRVMRDREGLFTITVLTLAQSVDVIFRIK